MSPHPDTGPRDGRDLGPEHEISASAATHATQRPVTGPQYIEQISGINVTIEKQAGVFEIKFSDAPGALRIYPDGKLAVAGSLNTPSHWISAKLVDGTAVVLFKERGAGAAFKRVIQEMIGAEGATRDFYARIKFEGEKVSLSSDYTSETSALTFMPDGTVQRGSSR